MAEIAKNMTEQLQELAGLLKPTRRGQILKERDVWMCNKACATALFVSVMEEVIIRSCDVRGCPTLMTGRACFSAQIGECKVSKHGVLGKYLAT